MFDTLQAAPGDPILALMAEFRSDPRQDKIDLGVGVYKDKNGSTPVMAAVKAAEQLLLETQKTKSYVGLAGDGAFNNQMAALIFGNELAQDRLSAIQVPGGGGALRLLFELVETSRPDCTVWLSDPTWANHRAIIDKVGLKRDTYAYFDRDTLSVDFDGMIESLTKAARGDCVLLHGCCHNPTGANLTLEQWQQLAEFLHRRGLVPLVDLAYQGFGDGLDTDVEGLRNLVLQIPEILVAASCSKNFGLYRDRVGAAFVVANPESAANIQSVMQMLGRANHSMPPDHGAAVVRMILEQDKLRSLWETELNAMRNRMLALRSGLAHALRQASGSDRFSFIDVHRGMFSLSGATKQQVAALKNDHGIYVIGDGRINIAGLPEDRLDFVAGAFVSVGM